MEYVETISKLPFPTQEQIVRFKEHILGVHSWYKLIPLIEGSIFTVYMEPDLDREYPTHHPKLPFGNTMEGYQKAFGHLAYQYCINKFYNQDYCNKIINGKRVEMEITQIPENHRVNWSFKLYPYCHFDFGEAITLFEEDIINLENGIPHPQRELLISWYKFLTQRNVYWYNNLNDKEKAYLLSIDNLLEVKNKKNIPETIFNYIELKRAVSEIEGKLRSIEELKIEMAIERLMTDFNKLKSA